MRILHLTTHLNIGGITTYIESLVKPFRPHGIETFVLSSGGERAKSIRDKGATVLELPIRTKSEIHPKLWLALPHLVRLIRHHKIDLLHAHTRVTQVLAGAAACQTGIPVVTTCHGFYKRRLGRRLFPAWGKAVIAISQGVADHLAKDFHVNPKQIKVIYNAVDLEELDNAFAQHDPNEVRRRYGFKLDDQILGITARLVEDKGHEYLIRAANLLVSEFPKIKLLIVGEGRSRKEFEALIQSLQLGDRVVFSGNKADITEPMAAFDIFVLPATWREGFGLSIIEAMACRKPVIVTNIWSLNTLIQDKVTGLMVEPKKIEPLAHAISVLLKNPETAKRMAECARTMVEGLFSINRMAQEIHDTYKAVLERRP